MYKVIHTLAEKDSILIVQKAFGRTAPTLTVNVQICSLVPMVVKYNYVPYHCFSKDEARLCFKEFILCVKAALDECSLKRFGKIEPHRTPVEHLHKVFASPVV